ncbi:MAG: hypothetical protein IPK82_19725 [Polyangiaceae bacterium]|nr:hypothetical protein [Polyangiaceae bacterium]
MVVELVAVLVEDEVLVDDVVVAGADVVVVAVAVGPNGFAVAFVVVVVVVVGVVVVVVVVVTGLVIGLGATNFGGSVPGMFVFPPPPGKQNFCCPLSEMLKQSL